MAVRAGRRLARAVRALLWVLAIGGCGDDDAPGEGAGPAPDAGAGSFGDVGAACDPRSGTSTCAAQCLELSDGSGVCIDTCGAPGDVTCPAGYKCNTLPVEDGTAQVCLPNASCGELDFRGFCTGTVLSFCDLEGPLEIDCAQLRSASGEPLACGLVSESIGHDCVSPSFTGGCGGETESGRCDGDTRVACSSQATGSVVREDCAALGLECVVAPDGLASCGSPGTAGCGALTFEGECEAGVLRYCRDYELVTVDCASVGECRWQNNDVGFDCAEVAAPGGAYSVTGSWLFEKVQATESGLGGTLAMPVRHALVRVARASDDLELARGFTAEDGGFSLSHDEPTDVYVEVVAIGDVNSHPVAVRDCPLADCGGIGAVYSARSASFTPAAEVGLGPLTVTRALDSGAFNIFDQCIRGADFAIANFGRPPPPHVVQWAAGSNTEGGTSYFTPQGRMLYILGTFVDSDEFDDSVLLHEYGHFLESAFSRSDSPGGAHDGSPTDPRLAWGEGYGTYVGARIAGTPIYIDTQAAGASVVDLRGVGPEFYADPTSIRGMSQPVSEYLVAEILWQIDAGGQGTSAFGSAAIFDVLGSYFPAPERFLDRGVAGVDLVDFLDGWFCRGHAERAVLEQIVTGTRGFPYDYAALPSCQ